MKIAIAKEALEQIGLALLGILKRLAERVLTAQQVDSILRNLVFKPSELEIFQVRDSHMILFGLSERCEDYF